MIRISRNDTALINIKSDGILVIRTGSGISRTISMSKTIKITARRKKRIENGTRADRMGSKPHSNGESFSRLLSVVRLAVSTDNIYTNRGIRNAVIDDSIISFIYLKFEKIFL